MSSYHLPHVVTERMKQDDAKKVCGTWKAFSKRIQEVMKCACVFWGKVMYGTYTLCLFRKKCGFEGTVTLQV